MASPMGPLEWPSESPAADSAVHEKSVASPGARLVTNTATGPVQRSFFTNETHLSHGPLPLPFAAAAAALVLS